MRLVAWNAEHQKKGPVAEHLEGLNPDVAVLPEWAELPMSRPAGVKNFVQFGEVGERGLAVASWGEWSVSAADVPPIGGVVVGAVEVDGPTPFKMVALWTCLSDKPKVNPLTEALDAWSHWLSSPLVVAGDFNTGCSWQDRKTGPMSHFPLLEQLEQLGLHSAYHVANGVEQGIDEHPTHWHSSGKNFMIDHVFTPKNWEIASVTVGDERTWKGRADHAPLVVDVHVGWPIAAVTSWPTSCDYPVRSLH